MPTESVLWPANEPYVLQQTRRAILTHNPKFSIVTVTWNDLSGVRETAQSVRAQTFRDFEWLVIDGGSADGTVEAAAAGEFAGAKFTSEPDKGLYDAMNKGLGRVTGDYVIFMNGGDTFADEEVLRDVAALDDFGETSVIYGDAFEVDGAYAVYKPAMSHRAIPYTMFAHHQSIFYRRADIGGLRYELDYRIGADWVFTARMIRKTGKVRGMRRAICRFERGGLSQSGDPKVLAQIHSERVRALSEVFRVPVPAARALLTVKETVEAIRRRYPGLYDRLRMRRA